MRHAKLKGIPLGSNNKVVLVSAHSTVALEGKFQLWKRVKTGFYNSGKNNTLTVIKVPITRNFILAYSKMMKNNCTKFRFSTEKVFRDIPFYAILHHFVSTM